MHLDQIVWLPNWQRQSKDEIQRKLSQSVIEDNWIIEGVSSVVMSHADIIIFLDPPLPTIWYRAIKRTLKHAFRQRAELPENCSDLRVVFKLFKLIHTFHWIVKPDLRLQIGQYENNKKIYHIHSLKQASKIISVINSRYL